MYAHKYRYRYKYNYMYRSHVSRWTVEKRMKWKRNETKDNDNDKDKEGQEQNSNSHFHNVDCNTSRTRRGCIWLDICIWQIQNRVSDLWIIYASTQHPELLLFLNEIAKGIDFHFSFNFTSTCTLRRGPLFVRPPPTNDRRQPAVWNTSATHSHTHTHSCTLAQWACKFLAI